MKTKAKIKVDAGRPDDGGVDSDCFRMRDP